VAAYHYYGGGIDSRRYTFLHRSVHRRASLARRLLGFERDTQEH
jgi:hypothetical protein